MKLGICFLLTNGFLYEITDYCYLIKIIGDKINGLFSQTSSLNGYYSEASPKDHLYSKTSSLLRLIILEVYKQFYIGTYSGFKNKHFVTRVVSLIREVSMYYTCVKMLYMILSDLN